MKCVKCGCSFCWLCMEVIEDDELPMHYKVFHNVLDLFYNI